MSNRRTRRAQLIARLMAGIETPGDLNAEELREHKEDLLAFLQSEYCFVT